MGYEVVRAAQAAALEEVRAGAVCKEVDEHARERVVSGFGIGFDHGLGHGVGLEVHEAPRLARTAEGALEAGNMVTVEPGLYVPGEFGIRIEDLVAVTERRVRGPDRVPEGARHRRRLMALAAVAAFVGAFVQSTTGFGFALLLSPALFAVMDPVEAVLTLLVLGLALNVLVLFERGRPEHVDWRAADADADRGAARPGGGCRGADAALEGGAPGGGRSGGDRGGRVAAAPAAQARGRPQLPAAAGVAAGFVSGALTTSISVSGPPIVLWLEARGAPPGGVPGVAGGDLPGAEPGRRGGAGGGRGNRVAGGREGGCRCSAWWSRATRSERWPSGGWTGSASTRWCWRWWRDRPGERGGGLGASEAAGLTPGPP